MAVALKGVMATVRRVAVKAEATAARVVVVVAACLAAAAYAVLDTRAASLTFFRVPYDHSAAAAKIRAAGLPERFALRLEGLK